ncbi:MAG: hypothetical protein AAGF97_02550 [Planctomycetota bacterium]
MARLNQIITAIFGGHAGDSKLTRFGILLIDAPLLVEKIVD